MTILANILTRRTDALLQDSYKDLKRSMYTVQLPVEGSPVRKSLPFVIHFAGNKIFLRPLSPDFIKWSPDADYAPRGTVGSPANMKTTPLAEQDFVIALHDEHSSFGTIEVIEILGLDQAGTTEGLSIICTDSVDLWFLRLPLANFIVQIVEEQQQGSTKLPTIGEKSAQAKQANTVVVKKIAFSVDKNDGLARALRHKLAFQDFSRLHCIQAGYMVGYNRREQSCVVIAPNLRPHSETQHALVHYKGVKEPDLILADQMGLKVTSDNVIVSVKQNAFVFYIHKRYAAVEIFTMSYKNKTLRLSVHAEDSGSLIESELSYFFSIYPVSLLTENDPTFKLGESPLIASALGINILDAEMSTKQQKVYHFCMIYGMNFLPIDTAASAGSTASASVSASAASSTANSCNSSFNSTLADDPGPSTGTISGPATIRGKTPKAAGQPPRPERAAHGDRKGTGQQGDTKSSGNTPTIGASGMSPNGSAASCLRTDMIKTDNRVFRKNNLFLYIGKKLVGSYSTDFIPNIIAANETVDYLFIASTNSNEIHICEIAHSKSYNKLTLHCLRKIITPSRTNVAAIVMTPQWVIIRTVEDVLFTFRYRDLISHDGTNMLLEGLTKLGSGDVAIPLSLKSQLSPVDLFCKRHYGTICMPHTPSKELPNKDVSSIALTPVSTDFNGKPNRIANAADVMTPMANEVMISNVLESKPPIINLSDVSMEGAGNQESGVEQLTSDAKGLTGNESEPTSVTESQINKMIKVELETIRKEKEQQEQRQKEEKEQMQMQTQTQTQSGTHTKENDVTLQELSSVPESPADGSDKVSENNGKVKLDLLSEYGENHYCLSDSLRNIVDAIEQINIRPSSSPDISPLDIGNLKTNGFVSKNVREIECQLLDRILNSQIRSSGRPKEFYLGVEVRVLERLFKYCINFYANFIFLELWCYFITSYGGKLPAYYLTSAPFKRNSQQNTDKSSILYTFEVGIFQDKTQLCKMLEVCLLPGPEKGFIDELRKKGSISDDIYGTIPEDKEDGGVTGKYCSRDSEEFKFHQINFIVKHLAALYQKFNKDISADIIDKSFNCNFNLKLLQEIIEESGQFIAGFKPSIRLLELQTLLEDQLAKVLVRTISVQSYFLRTSVFAKSVEFLNYPELVDISTVLDRLVPSGYADWDLLSKICFMDSRVKTLIAGMHSIANMQSEAIQNLLLQLNETRNQQGHSSASQSTIFSSLITSNISGHSMVAGSRAILSSQLLASRQNNTTYIQEKCQPGGSSNNPLTLSDVSHAGACDRPSIAAGKRGGSAGRETERFVSELDKFEDITNKIPILNPQEFVGTSLVSPEKFAGSRSEHEEMLQLKSPSMPAGRTVTDSLVMSLYGQQKLSRTTKHAPTRSVSNLPVAREGALFLSSLTRSGSTLGPARDPAPQDAPMKSASPGPDKDFVAVAPAMVLTANLSADSLQASNFNPPVSIEQRLRKILFEKNVDLSHLTYHSESDTLDSKSGTSVAGSGYRGSASQMRVTVSAGSRSEHLGGNSLRTDSSISLEDMLTYSLVEKMNAEEKMKLVTTIARNSGTTIEDINELILQTMNEIDTYYASNKFIEDIRNAANAIIPNSDLAHLIMLGATHPEKLTAQEAIDSTLEELVKSRVATVEQEAKIDKDTNTDAPAKPRGGMFTKMITAIRGVFGRRSRAMLSVESQGKSLILSCGQSRASAADTDTAGKPGRMAHTLGISSLQ